MNPSKDDNLAAAGNEIERKFLMRPIETQEFLNKLSYYQTIREHITQVYVEKRDDYECRVRKVLAPRNFNIYYTKTEKWGNGLARKELESNISEDDFNTLSVNSLCTIEKMRHTIIGTTMCFDVYDNGLITMEIEFADLEHANAYDVLTSPLGCYKNTYGVSTNILKDDELGPLISALVEKEITGDKTYSNYNLALQGNGN